MSHPHETPQCRTSHFLSALTPAGKVQNYACGPINFKAKNKMWDVPSPSQVWFFIPVTGPSRIFGGLKQVPGWFGLAGSAFDHLPFSKDTWEGVASDTRKKENIQPSNVMKCHIIQLLLAIKHHRHPTFSQTSITISQGVLAKIPITNIQYPSRLVSHSILTRSPSERRSTDRSRSVEDGTTSCCRMTGWAMVEGQQLQQEVVK